MTLQQAKELTNGTIIFAKNYHNRDGSKQRWRVNGQVKIWKRSPLKVKVPLKHGLYAFGYLTEDNLNEFDTKCQ